MCTNATCARHLKSKLRVLGNGLHAKAAARPSEGDLFSPRFHGLAKLVSMETKKGSLSVPSWSLAKQQNLKGAAGRQTVRTLYSACMGCARVARAEYRSLQGRGIGPAV